MRAVPHGGSRPSAGRRRGTAARRAARRRPPSAPRRPSTSRPASLRCARAARRSPASGSSSPAPASRARASASFIVSSGTPISSTLRPARSRAIGSGGSLRVAIASCDPAGRWSASSAIASQALAVVQQVDVIEEQRDRLRHRVHRPRELRNHRRCNRQAARRRPVEPLEVDRFDPVERGRGVGEQALGIVVALVHRQPRDARGAALGPLCEQRRLAVAGRRDDRDDRTVTVRVEPVQHAGTTNALGPRDRWDELRLEELAPRFVPRSSVFFVDHLHPGPPPRSMPYRQRESYRFRPWWQPVGAGEVETANGRIRPGQARGGSYPSAPTSAAAAECTRAAPTTGATLSTTPTISSSVTPAASATPTAHW